MSTPETFQPKHEHGAETAQAAAEHSAEHAKAIEKTAEQSPDTQERRVEAARHEAKKFFAKETDNSSEQSDESTMHAVHRVTKQTRDAAYEQTMRLIRTELNGPSRLFSKIIHAPIVERSSEVIGGTLARPNAVMAGSSTALVLVISVYIIARTFGYQLSGFETIGAFLLGWVIGLVYDYVRVMALGRRS